MTEHGKRSSAFYASIVLYSLLIFFTQWSLSASRMDGFWLQSILSSVVNFIILPSIIALTIYGIFINFKYYARHKWFTIIFIATILSIAVITKSASLTLPLLIGFTGLQADNRKAAKVAVLSLSILLIVTCIFSSLGINGGNAINKPLFGVDNTSSITLTALGLSNPNSVMLIFFNVIALLLFLCRTKRQTLFASVALVVITVILSAVTGSTTGLIVGILTVLLILVAKHSERALKIFRKITPWMFVLITLMTIAVAINFGSSSDRLNDVNSTLSGRPYLWNVRIENGSYINLHGSNDYYAGDPDYALDNAPLYIMVYYGLITYTVFAYVFYSGSKKIKEPELLAYILAATLLMFSEKIELYGLVLIFLQKAITEHHLLDNKKKDTLWES